MALWAYKEEDVTKETNTNTGDSRILKNGVYDTTITSAWLQKSQKSLAEAVTLQLESETGNARVQLWIKNSKGEPIEFTIGKLNRLCYLIKVNPNDIEPRTTKIKGFTGEYERDLLPILINKEIGVFLEITANGKYPQYDVVDFFDTKTKRTSNEVKGNAISAIHAKMVEKYKDAIPVRLTNDDTDTVASNNTGDDEFPF
jgi:DNA-binding Xre family transcriptional regulator